MKTTFTLALILCSFAVFAQEIKLITKNTQPNPFTINREEYYVLKDEKKIKHGPYKKWVNGNLLSEGFYKNDKMDSTWINRGLAGAIISTGNYKDDERAGIWKFYSKGEIEQEYDFTTNTLVSFRPEIKATTYQIINGADTTYDTLSRPPLAIGGSRGYLDIVAKNLRYPVPALKSNTTSKVYVVFSIDETGKAADHKVLKRNDKNLDAEAVRVVKLIDIWLPALKDNKPVKIMHMIPIIFNNMGVINP